MTYIMLAIIGLLGMLAFALLWNKPALLIYFVVLFCFVSDLFVSFLRVPAAIKYVGDLLCFYLLLCGIIKYMEQKKRLNTISPFVFIGILAALTLVSFLVNHYSVVTLAIGAFQFFKGFSFFIACICILTIEDVKRMSKIFVWAAFANLIVSLIEYFRYHAKWDNNGGLFGIIVGCNGKMNVFLVIVTAIVAVQYLNRKMSTVLAAGVLGSCLITATISELKIYYVELAISLALVVLLSKPSKKTLTFLAGGVIGIVVAVQVLGVLYPNFANFFNISSMVEYSTGDYGNSEGSVNRLSGVSMMVNEYLHLPMQKLFGIGLGNGHEGTVFYSRYEYLKYIFFYSSYLVTELGILGLITYCLFFINNAVQAVRYSLRMKENAMYCRISAIVAVMCFVFLIYDASLITTVSYLVYLWLAVPFILNKQSQRESIRRIESVGN